MKTYDSKLVDFLANYNVVQIQGPLDYINLRNALKVVGLDMLPKEKFIDALGNAERYDKQHGRTYETDPILYMEYRNDKGFGFWRGTKEELVDWYGVEPLTVKEILEEVGVKKI